MWYHYVVGLFAAYYAITLIIMQVNGSYNGMLASRFMSLGAIALCLVAIRWSYSGATAPAPVFSAGRR